MAVVGYLSTIVCPTGQASMKREFPRLAFAGSAGYSFKPQTFQVQMLCL